MTIGLLIGYFEPLHLGHLQDINVAAGHCDELHVVVVPRQDGGRFQPTLQDKARWVQVACQHFGFVKVHITQSAVGDYAQSLTIDDALMSELSIDERPLVFARASAQIHGDTRHTLVTLPSHDYDDEAIYQNPMANFHHIAPSAKMDYTQTVCIVGGESSGKTTLVQKLANHYGATVALEMGRLYTHSDLGGTEVGLQYRDYLAIVTNHARAILDAKKNATAPIVLVDTDFVTTQTFCEEYEGRTHPVAAAFADEMRMDFTIYLDNNVKWVADGMRRLGSQKQRSQFADRLLKILSRHCITPVMIDDDNYHARYLQAVRFIDEQVLGVVVNAPNGN